MNKNEDISINTGSKENVAQNAQQVASITAMAVLANLDRYMAAGGYADDHPWRVEIASASGDEDAVEDIIVGADLKLTHRADPNLTQGGALRF